MPLDRHDYTTTSQADSIEALPKLWRQTAAKRDDAGRHVTAQILRRCAGELEIVLQQGNDTSADGDGTAE